MFWRRGGSRFDDDGKGLSAWLLRIVMFLVVALVVVFIARLWLSAQQDNAVRALEISDYKFVNSMNAVKN